MLSTSNPVSISLPLDESPLLNSSNMSKFPHTRALLSSIWREYRPSDLAVESEVQTVDDLDDGKSLDSSLLVKATVLLQEEREDDLKSFLKESIGAPDNGEILDEHVLNLMHKHRDDMAGVPFLFLTPNRRPMSRPSSRASTHSVRINRPDTPNSIPSSPLGIGFRRPHTPLASPMNPNKDATSYITSGESPLPAPAPSALAVSSSPPSPLSSPKLLNAKAAEFRPIPRPLSSAGSASSLLNLRAETPSPDLWSHRSSNLAIAAPLLPDNSLLQTRTSSSLAKHAYPDEEDNDEFDPFALKPPPSFHPIPSVSEFDSSNSTSTSSQSRTSCIDEAFNDEYAQHEYDDVDTSPLDGMTPLDVLSSVFGSSLSQPDLDEALESNGYDFEAAMTWLMDRSSATQQPPSMPQPPFVATGSGRVYVVPRDSGFRGGLRGGLGAFGRGGPVHSPNRTTGSKVCRYFLAGECMRADCRFSHDIDRALCRFWLRGVCAKGESCEFMHHLPHDADIRRVTTAMSNHTIGSGNSIHDDDSTQREFPVLGSDIPDKSLSLDPSRIRFASAVKRPTPMHSHNEFPRSHKVPDADFANFTDPGIHSVSRPSPRIKLRMPALLPTLPTGESLNSLYMNYRSRALQLGAARNACLSRAADAWRRGDGAAAKRFSREGHDLNSKMKAEAAVAASRLVRERAKVAMDAVRSRDAGWSDDPGDRTSKGRICGGGLGVSLGIAGKDVGHDTARLTPEERTEVMLDLHGLHSGEAVEVLEEYLLALEKEHFLGLAFLIVGEQKHTGMQDPNRGVSKARLAAGVREWLHKWGYPWMERDGIMVVDPLTHG